MQKSARFNPKGTPQHISVRAICVFDSTTFSLRSNAHFLTIDVPSYKKRFYDTTLKLAENGHYAHPRDKLIAVLRNEQPRI